MGNGYGPGYTGRGGWLPVEVDLTPYSGQRVHLRFHYVTDDAINGSGLCFDDIAVPEIGFLDDGEGDQGWDADGFIRIDNRVPQDFIVQIIEIGDQTRVRQMPFVQDNRGEMVINRLENLTDVVLVVAALAPRTLQSAEYSLMLEPAP